MSVNESGGFLMELVLSIKKSGESSQNMMSSRVFDASGGMIGRARDAKWVLPDTGNELSRYHATISFRDNRFFITDTSRNGIFTEEGVRLPAGQPVPLQHNECFKMGSYLIQARLARTVDKQQGFYTEFSHSPVIPDNDFLGDVFQQEGVSTVSGEFSAENEQNVSITDVFSGSHEPSPKSSKVIPEDSLQMGTRVHVPVLTEEQAQKAEPQPVSVEENHHDESGAMEALKAFEQALEFDLSEMDREERIKAFGRFGGMLKTSIQQLQKTLRTRTELKNELRLGVTALQGQGNNPLKFSTDYPQAMRLLMGDNPGYMEPAKAIGAAFQDIQSHQVASLAATKASLKQAVYQMSPERLVYQFSQESHKRLWFFSSHANYWKAYTNYYQTLEDNDEWFHTLISRTYATVYEEQVQLLNTAFQGSS